MKAWHDVILSYIIKLEGFSVNIIFQHSAGLVSVFPQKCFNEKADIGVNRSLMRTQNVLKIFCIVKQKVYSIVCHCNTIVSAEMPSWTLHRNWFTNYAAQWVLNKLIPKMTERLKQAFLLCIPDSHRKDCSLQVWLAARLSGLLFVKCNVLGVAETSQKIVDHRLFHNRGGASRALPLCAGQGEKTTE